MTLIMKLGIIALSICLLASLGSYTLKACPYELLNSTFHCQCLQYTDITYVSIYGFSYFPLQAVTNTGIHVPANTSQTTGNNQENDNLTSQSVESVEENPNITERYHLLPIIIGFTILYFISYLIYDFRKIKARTYKRIWSIVLIGSFTVVGITGIILIFLINQGIDTPADSDILFWHVESGIVMTITTVFHMIIRWKSVEKIFNGKI